MTEYEIECPMCWHMDETLEDKELAERKMQVHFEDTGHKMEASVL